MPAPAADGRISRTPNDSSDEIDPTLKDADAHHPAALIGVLQALDQSMFGGLKAAVQHFPRWRTAKMDPSKQRGQKQSKR